MAEIRSEDLAKYPVRRALVTAGNPDILLADEKVSIFDVLKEYCGLNVPGYRYKSHCPFGVQHVEGAESERCFQVYENNTGWCFQHQARYTPTVLVMFVTGGSRTRAANVLLEKYGIAQRMSYRERYGEVAALLEQRRQSVGDVQELVMTLQRELSADEQFSAHEFDPAVREAWESALQALDKLSGMGASTEVLGRWYHTAKGRLQAATLTAVSQTEYDVKQRFDKGVEEHDGDDGG